MKKTAVGIAFLMVLTLVVLPGCSATNLLLAQAAPPAVAQSSKAAAAPPAVQPNVALSQSSVLDELESTLAAIYDKVNPSVVSIQVVQKQDVSQLMPELPGFPFFNMPSPQTPQYQYGAGSGFVWDKDGHIVTNNHVVEGADTITVEFSDGTVVPAELVGADHDSDLAVVKVDLPADRLQPVQIADSTRVKVGELVVAIGNPFGLENTMTVGFVSALQRSLPVEASSSGGPSYTIPDVIQTDAPINPGNSGGVLLSDSGEVVGVTSAIISPVQASAGIGFAIPSAIVEKVVPALIEKGHYSHAWLGISGITLNPDMAKAMNLDADQRGALVAEVIPGSPADDAGLRGSDRTATVDGGELQIGGDVIIAMNDAPVRNFDDLVANLARLQAGQEVKLTILRDGHSRDMTITLAERPGAQTSGETSKDEATAGPASLGITGMTLNADVAQAMDLPQDQEGVLVGQVEAGSAADKAGLHGSYKPATIGGSRTLVGGDVIVGWNGKPLTNMDQLRAFIRESQPGDKVTLTIIRDGQEMTLDVTLQA